VARLRIVLHVVTAVTVAAGLLVAVTTGGASGAASPRNAASVPAPVDLGAPPAAVTAPSPTTTSPPATGAPTPTPTSTLPPAPAPTAPPPATVAGTVVPWQPQLVARVTTDPVAVYAQPGAPSAVLTVPGTTWFGTRYVLPVIQLGGDWLKVLLPVGAGNGSTGWIRASDASLSHIDDEVSIDLAARRLVWARGGVVQLDVSVAVGAQASPTPRGTFFVTDVVPENPQGPYGPWAIALNAVSNALTEFEGGLPQIAIHGTDDPGSIGQAASSGCVRIDTVSLDRLAGSLPIGTPVTIR
jgi:lipoprotein-anchoring transpeptidase ErfK/SrfK